MIPLPQPVLFSPAPAGLLLLGHSKWLIYIDFATVVDDDVFKRLVASICLCSLNLLHHILEEKKKRYTLYI